MTTAENQEQADARIPELLRVPAEIIGVSMEPLLSRVILRSEWMKRISWVIVGGESGDRARPMHPFWARELRDQCRGAGIPFFFKQWGEWAPLDSEQWGKRGYADVEDGGSFPMRRVGKSRAGRLLFGQEYNEVPGDVTPKETH
jgi:protein gp37